MSRAVSSRNAIDLSEYATNEEKSLEKFGKSPHENNFPMYNLCGLFRSGDKHTCVSLTKE